MKLRDYNGRSASWALTVKDRCLQMDINPQAAQGSGRNVSSAISRPATLVEGGL
jgi:hypothetical protein